MSNSPESGREQWPASWASPNAPAPSPEVDQQRAETQQLDGRQAGDQQVEGQHGGDQHVDDTQRFDPPNDPQNQPATDYAQRAPAYAGTGGPGYPSGGSTAYPAAGSTAYPAADSSSPWGGQPPYGPPVPQQAPQAGRTGGRRGPGWGGVVAVGAAAAVLSSLFTLGITESRDNTAATSSYSAGTGSGNGSGNTAADSSAPLVTGGTGAPNWVAVAKAVEPSVVSVRVTSGNSGDEGSGIVYDGNGHVLTNHHVVAAAEGGNGQVNVILSDGRSYPATIVGSDASTDLAVLSVKNAPSDLKPASFGDSSAVRVGDPVMAIGNPLGLSDTVTTGIVSALNRPVTTSQQPQSQDPFGSGQVQGETVVTNAIQTDAAVNPGNSGGALVDATGRVIGVTSSIASLGASSSGQAGNIGLGFAIPVGEARSVADQLVKTGTVKHAFLGVSLQDGTVSIDGATRQAAIIRSITDGAAAAQAGARTGDSVIAVNGASLDGADSLVARIRALQPGTKVTLTVVRDGKKVDLQVTLGTKPASNNG
jgi:putative serine protease PepD